MSIRFNADEVFRIAERIEENGARFYRAAAKAVPEESAGMFYDLAAWEDQHLKTFAAMREKLSDAARGETAWDPDDEAAAYLQAVADGSVFDLGEEPLAAVGENPTIEDILRFALQREKDSITFYVGLQHLAPGRLGKDDIDRIIREEMSHVSLLTRRIAALRQ